ncbi:uncharacterized protein LOC110463308 isoform X2 [Mizuhopecten yessoensis]|uniref:uncharacterized protein LOC110463308 isoform X2 n=1 Tax=Mizuhopecten yessoensis TaxID=6573 RepID=UPI000B45CD68|nr:uncharacterized protein LOC110463308 isoform X2 [Mizuhopecten yessoensis]
MHQQQGPPLPPNWTHAFTPEGQIYFINHNDGSTSWQDPRMFAPGQVQQVAPGQVQQGQSILLGIITMFDLVTANEEQHDHQRKEWRKWRSQCEQEGNTGTLQACVKAFQERVCVQGFPPRTTEGAKMASEIYTMIEAVMDDSKSNKVYKPEIHQQLLDLYLFYFTKMGQEPEEYATNIDHVMSLIPNAYSNKHEKNPYMVLEKVDILREHWKAVGVIITSDGFIFERQVRMAQTLVEHMVKCVLKKKWSVEVWDDMLDIMKKFYVSENALKHQNVLRYIRSLLDETPKEIYKNNPQLVEKLVPVITDLLRKQPGNIVWAYGYCSIMTENASAQKGTELNWFQILKALMEADTGDGAYACYYTLREGKFKKIWNWKQNFQHAIDILKPIGEVHLKLTGDKDKTKRLLDYCGKTIETLLEQFKIAKIPEKLNGDMALLAITMMEKRSERLNGFIQVFFNYVTFEANKDVIPDIIKRFSVLLFDRDYIWHHAYSKRCGSNVMKKSLTAYSTGKEIPDDVNETFIKMFLWTMQTQGLDYIDMENGNLTIYGTVATQFLLEFVQKHVSSQNSGPCKPLIPAILKQMEHEEEQLRNTSSSIIRQISSTDPTLLDGQLSTLVEWYKRTSSSDAISALTKPYEESDGFTKQDFYNVMTALEENGWGDISMEYSNCTLLKAMAVKQGELFTQHHVDFMVTLLEKKKLQYFILTALSEIIPKRPELFGDNIIEHVLRNQEIDQMYASGIQVVAVNLGLKKEALVDTIMKELILLSKDFKEPSYQYQLLDAIQTLGAKYGVDSLKPHRKYFEELQQEGRASYLKVIGTSIVNAMDGISMEGIVTDVIQTKQKVNTLDKKVTNTEKEVKGMKTTVDRHDKEIKTVKTGIKTVTKRVDVVKKDLEETKVKVEEIDNKTMSNAPAWSRDLTKLMNPKSEHDWRLLAQRLGYSPKDIKAWATQHDPCMALLSEWYATHKTIEASHAVLTILQEMNRLDAAAIVENAMKAVEDVVEEAPEYTTPPPIFLSYQWGHQNEVKLLRQHLLMAGYECWIDVGQMGGGDKLFEKIDNGIRGAKVVICCVSEKYSKSPNCNREVNLSVTLGKPMIPLLMEKMGWPPQGSMGPIFSEYLFVRFFQRKGEETKDQRYWPVPKFHELLMQLNIYKTMPDESLITKEYRDWWVPVAEEIIISKKPLNTEGQSTASTADGKKKENVSPDVFLSYQWGKQKEVKQLYKRLCELGLTCWMDIYQMGGGDSLYEKIDRGVRGCKIVLTCVTTKYAVSANCRREVSLADSLKRPVVPLLLEKMDWPPSGPMSMVFTQLLFINFYRDEKVQMTWTGDKFDELLAKITEHVPNTIGYVVDTTKQEVKETTVATKRPEKKSEIKAPVSKFQTAAKENTSPVNEPSSTVAVEKETDKEHIPAPPPALHTEASPSAPRQPPPPPPPPAYSYDPRFAQPQPHMSGQPYMPAQQYAPAQPHAQPYSQPQHYGQPQPHAQHQQPPYGHQPMYGQAQPHMQHPPSQAAPTQARQTNEKSSSCVLL